MSVAEAKTKVTATEYFRWTAYLDEELLGEPNKLESTVARVAYEVYQLRATLSAFLGSRLPEQKVKDFVPKYRRPPTQEELDEKSQASVTQSKSVWFGLLGLDADGNSLNAAPPAPEESPATPPVASPTLASVVNLLANSPGSPLFPKTGVTKRIKPKRNKADGH